MPKTKQDATPLRLKKADRVVGLTSYRAAAHRMLDREFNRALELGLRVDGYMLVTAARDEQLNLAFRSDGRWDDVGDMLLALRAADHKAVRFWFGDADWTEEA